MSGWAIEHRRAGAASLHAFEPPDGTTPTLVVADVDAPALVLGSTQSGDVVDAARVEAAGLAVVRRRSGGSSVVVAPEAQTWVDVWIPRGHDLWLDDVVAAALPIGDAWARVMADLGFAGPAVHRGGLVPTRWSHLVCFAGQGPGEVLTEDGRKLVGLSQRRTREWMRVQTMVHRRWDPTLALTGLAMTQHDRGVAHDELRAAVASTPEPAVVLVRALAAALD